MEIQDQGARGSSTAYGATSALHIRRTTMMMAGLVAASQNHASAIAKDGVSGGEKKDKKVEPERPSALTIKERRKILAAHLREKNNPRQGPFTHQVPEITVNGVTMTLKAVYE